MATAWKPLLICPTRTLSHQIAGLLSQQMPGAQVTTSQDYPYRDDINALVTQRPNLILLDASADPDRAVEIISLLQTFAPQIPIVALLATTNPDFILRCLRQGATEFLISPISADQLSEVLVRLNTKIGELNGNPESRMVCVMPAKGACGATTLATTLAYQWKKSSQKRFLLGDLDPMAGTLSFLLKIKAPYSFLDVLSRSEEGLDADLWRGMVINRNGVDVLLSPEEPMQGLDQIKDPSDIVMYSSSAYDYVFLDTGGVYGDWNLGLARACDDLLLVTTNELPALQAAQRALQYLERNRVGRGKVKLIVNRYSRDLGLSKEVIGTALNIEVFATLPSDFDGIQKSLMEGKPIPANSAFGKGVGDLADLLGAKEEARKLAKPAEDKKSGKGLLSFFRR
jgi:pilus assembly protein CpaE